MTTKNHESQAFATFAEVVDEDTFQFGEGGIPPHVCEFIEKLRMHYNTHGVPNRLVFNLVPSTLSACGFYDERSEEFDLPDLDPQSEISLLGYQCGEALESLGGVEGFSEEERVRNIANTTEARLESLWEWIASDEERAADYIVEELSRLASDTICQQDIAWSTGIVFAAEDVRFSKREFDAVLDSLQALIPVMTSFTNYSIVEQAVNCAIRRFASLVPVEKSHVLLDFLSSGNAIDTRFVVIDGVAKVFAEEVPPITPEITRIADRVFQFAEKCTDSDVLCVGETSAIADVSLFALAAMHDARLPELLAQRKRDAPGWFLDIVRDRFQSLELEWESCEDRKTGLENLRSAKDLLD